MSKAFEMAVIEYLGPEALAHGTMSIYQAAEIIWNARGKVDAEICRTSGNPHQLQSIAESVWTLATAQHCAEAIEKEQCDAK